MEFAAEYYDACVRAALASWEPRYNVALTQAMPVITRRAQPTLTRFAFGFTAPGRTPDERPLIIGNARADTLVDKPAFRDAARTRRCLIPADGFYEWEKSGTSRRPHYFYRTHGLPFFFAGLWNPPVAHTPGTFCIITTRPNALLQCIHDRMPVMLTGPAASDWLGDEALSPAHITALCRPFPPEEMASHPVTPQVNHVGYEAPDCVRPYHAPPPEPDLFSHLA